MKTVTATLDANDTMMIQRKNILNSNANIDGISGSGAAIGGAAPSIMTMNNNNNNNADFLDLLGLDLTASGTTNTSITNFSHSTILDALGNGSGSASASANTIGNFATSGDYNNLINSPSTTAINLLNANGSNDLNSIIMDTSNITASVNVMSNNSNITNNSLPVSAACVLPAASIFEGSRSNNNSSTNATMTSNRVSSIDFRTILVFF